MKGRINHKSFEEITKTDFFDKTIIFYNLHKRIPPRSNRVQLEEYYLERHPDYVVRTRVLPHNSVVVIQDEYNNSSRAAPIDPSNISPAASRLHKIEENANGLGGLAASTI